MSQNHKDLSASCICIHVCCLKTMLNQYIYTCCAQVYLLYTVFNISFSPSIHPAEDPLCESAQDLKKWECCDLVVYLFVYSLTQIYICVCVCVGVCACVCVLYIL